jgi:cell division protein FtsQ
VLLNGAGQVARRALKPACVVLVGVVAALGGHWGYRHAAASTYFTVKRIEIAGTHRVAPEHLRQLLASNTGQGIFSVDLSRAARAITAHPWVRSAEVQRRLPDAITVQVTEQRAAAALHLGHLYLVNEKGEVFKRAEPAELGRLAVITGISRRRYLADSVAARAEILRALDVVAEYRRGQRPPLSEVSLGPDGETTIFLRRGGAALRFGARFGKDRLKRLDAVFAALGPELNRVRAIYLDHEVRPERVVVRMVNN